MILPLALRDFYHQDWPKTPMQIKIALFRGPLERLAAMHRMRCMHRDVMISNMLILSDDPPTAALCDYGKAIKANRHNSPYIDPIHSLASEIEPGGNRLYDNTVDLWALGFACCQILFPRMKLLRQKIDLPALTTINMQLEASGQPGGLLEKQFTHLIRWMMRWDPTQRFSAEQALSHECMHVPNSSKDADERASKCIATASATAPSPCRANAPPPTSPRGNVLPPNTDRIIAPPPPLQPQSAALHLQFYYFSNQQRQSPSVSGSAVPQQVTLMNSVTKRPMPQIQELIGLSSRAQAARLSQYSPNDTAPMSDPSQCLGTRSSGSGAATDLRSQQQESLPMAVGQGSFELLSELAAGQQTRGQQLPSGSSSGPSGGEPMV